MQETITIKNEVNNDNQMRSNVNLVRLITLELKKLEKNTLKQEKFSDTFESTICKNNNLQSVDKFN